MLVMRQVVLNCGYGHHLDGEHIEGSANLMLVRQQQVVVSISLLLNCKGVH